MTTRGRRGTGALGHVGQCPLPHRARSRTAGLGLALLLLLSSCAGAANRPHPAVTLTELASYSLDINEPSGLALDADRASLWVVGNNPSRVSRISLDGRTLATLTYHGSDLEGICLDASDSSLWVAEERQRAVVHLSRSGRELSRTMLPIGGVANHGLEGIALSRSGAMWVLQEKTPGRLLALTSTRALGTAYPLAFARDYSDLCWDPSGAWFWVLSDEDRSLFRCSATGEALADYGVSAAKPEGLAVDPESGRVYIASDSKNRLYIYALPQGETSQPAGRYGR